MACGSGRPLGGPGSVPSGGQDSALTTPARGRAGGPQRVGAPPQEGQGKRSNAHLLKARQLPRWRCLEEEARRPRGNRVRTHWAMWVGTTRSASSRKQQAGRPLQTGLTNGLISRLAGRILRAGAGLRKRPLSTPRKHASE